MWLHVLSDALIALAYYCIPITLVYLVRQRQDLPFKWIFLLFGASIAGCGTAYLLEVWTSHPVYWSGLVEAITAAVSLYTAGSLIHLVPKALALPSRIQLEQTLSNLKREVTERQQAELALHQSEARFQQLAARVPGVIFQCLLRPDGSMSLPYLSAGWRDICESEPEAIQQNPALLFKLIYSNDVHSFEQSVAVAQRTRQPWHWEGRIVTFSGQIKWVQGEARLEMQGNGALQWDGLLVDITERKRQEERLRLLESVVIHTNDAVLITEAEPVQAPGPPILYANEAFTRMTGYSLEEVLGKTTAQFLHGPKTDQAVLEQIRVAVTACLPTLVELLNYRKDGTEFWVEVSVVPVTDEPGCCSHWISIQRDITERKRQEERLRLLESVVIHANDAVLITEAEPLEYPGPGIIYANAAFTRMTGYSMEEVLLKSPRLLQGEKTNQAALDQVHKAVRNWQPIIVELLNYRKDGTEFWVELSIVPVADETGWYTHWVSIQRDITERKQSELALQQSEARHRALLDAIPDLMLRVSHDGTYLECHSPKDFFMLVPVKENLGIKETSVLPSELAQKRQHHREQALATGDIQIFDYQLLVHGVLRYEEARIVKSAEDEVLVIVRDITARKRAEHQIQASLSEKEVLLREIHHRVKNNLQVISSLLRLQAGYINDPQALEMFQASQDRVRVMALIHEQLYQSKDLAKINLAAYIHHLVNNIRRSYSLASDLVKFKINVSEVFLSIDQVIPCGLIINELVANTLKHAFPEQASGEVNIDLYSLTVEKYLLTIRDNGIGLPTDLDLEATKSLGLKLVDRLVRQLQGSIKFYNQGGAVFQIAFSRNY